MFQRVWLTGLRLWIQGVTASAAIYSGSNLRSRKEAQLHGIHVSIWNDGWFRVWQESTLPESLLYGCGFHGEKWKAAAGTFGGWVWRLRPWMAVLFSQTLAPIRNSTQTANAVFLSSKSAAMLVVPASTLHHYSACVWQDWLDQGQRWKVKRTLRCFGSVLHWEFCC